MENPKNIDAIITLITDNRTDFSLPYLVYTTKTIIVPKPMIRKIHANTHNVKDGIADIFKSILFFNFYFYSYMIYFFLILLMNKI